MRTLHLVLKRKWFETIASGEKREEYRDLSEYWVNRLLKINGGYKAAMSYLSDMPTNQVWQEHSHVTFRLGYHKNAPRMTFEIESISIGEGREEWGAETDKEYFIIKLGKRI